MICSKSELKGISRMQFLLKFNLRASNCCTCPPYARKFVRDKIFFEVTQAASFYFRAFRGFWLPATNKLFGTKFV